MFAEKLRLDGRVAVVTGGGQGIGLSCAGALGEFGARLVIADIDPAVAERGRTALAEQGFEAEAVGLDVTRSAQVDAVRRAGHPRPAWPDRHPGGQRWHRPLRDARRGGAG